MKFLKARALAEENPKPSILPQGEHKMQRGVRLDQGGDPRDLVSSVRPLGGTDKNAVTKLAEELHVNLDEVKGTGPDGQVTPKDVRLAARKSGTDSK